MPTPWEAHVQKTAQLTVFPTDAMLTAPAWGRVLFDRILFEFNRIARTNTLGVRMVPSTVEPQRNGMGADIRFDVTNGSCPHFNAAGRDQVPHNLDTSPGHVRGVCLRPLSHAGPQASLDFSWKAFIFLPTNPRVDATRTVGVPIRIAVALHELIHACGLSEDDPGHGQPNAPAPGPLDLFATGGIVQTDSLNSDNDRLFVGGTGVPDRTGQFTITPRTASVIQSVWLLGRQ